MSPVQRYNIPNIKLTVQGLYSGQRTHCCEARVCLPFSGPVLVGTFHSHSSVSPDVASEDRKDTVRVVQLLGGFDINDFLYLPSLLVLNMIRTSPLSMTLTHKRTRFLVLPC